MEFLRKLRRKLVGWNSFANEEEDNDDDDNNQLQVGYDINKHRLQEQRISTRIYVVLLNAILIILIIFTLSQQQTKIVTVKKPSITMHQQLQAKYPDTLNCPCSTTTIPYKTFANIEFRLHQICSSIFVSQEWITTLYAPDASRYLPTDFRSTASSQFKLLAAFCRLARLTLSDIVSDLNNTQLVSADILLEVHLDAQAQATSQLVRTVWSKRLMNALQLFIVATRSNQIISAMNTNYMVVIVSNGKDQMPGWYRSAIQWYVSNNTQTTICSCSKNSCNYPASFYLWSDNDNAGDYWSFKPQLHTSLDPMPGFVGACTALEALIQAKLVCIYNKDCIKTLINYFPELTRVIDANETLNRSLLTRFTIDDNVSYLLEELFLEQLITKINYEQYFTECTSNACTYSYTKRAEVIYMITVILGLYGGLQTVLRMLIPFVVKFIMKRKQRALVNKTVTIRTANFSLREKIRERVILVLGMFKKTIIRLNLFKSPDHSPEAVHHQRLSTRLYLSLLFGFALILILLTSLNEQTISATYRFPSYETYQRLRAEYPDTLHCPCSKIKQTYSTFLTLIPTFHPVCTSAFVQDIWLRQLILNRAGETAALTNVDWRYVSIGLFQALAALCDLASDTVNDALFQFGSRSFVSSRLLDETLLNNEINDIFNAFISNIENEFGRSVKIFRLLNQVDQYFSAAINNGLVRITNETNDGRVEADINFYGVYDLHNFQGICYCAFHDYCEKQLWIYQNRVTYMAPGFVICCSIIDSLLQSSLQCLFSDPCLHDLVHYLSYTNIYAQYVPLLNRTRLVRFTENSTITTIADKSFINEWIQTVSHSKYFETCIPSTCSFTYMHRLNLVYTITTLVAVFGGLSFVLRFLSPLIIKLIIRCHRQQENSVDTNEEQTPPNNRLRALCRFLLGFLRTKLVNLTLFRTAYFASVTDRAVAESLSRLATRLYICLLIICLTILFIYTLIEPQVVTKTISNPSLLIAQQLLTEHSDSAECPCTTISVPFNQFISIQPSFHQVCSSVFVTNDWREALVTDLYEMLKYLSKADYRFYILSHLQFIAGLCQQSMTQINDTIITFTSSSLVTSNLLSQSSFDVRISNLLNQARANAPTAFVRALDLIRTVNHGNALMTVFANNFQFNVRQNRTSYYSTLLTKPVVYNETTVCSCGLDPKCITRAIFTTPDIIEIKGFHMGCVPSEALLSSTLECFFDSECINLVRDHLPTNKAQTYALPLIKSGSFNSRYQMNTTIDDLVSQLFVEEWNSTINYERYFTHCAPNTCYYSYTERANVFHVATTLLGLYGGLIVVLRWSSPRLIKLGHRVQLYFREKRQNNINPVNS